MHVSLSDFSYECSAKISFHTQHMQKVSIPSEASCVPSTDHSEQNVCHIPYIHKASRLCEWQDDFSNVYFGQKFCHIQYNHMDFHEYEYSGDF
jgi:hypothetical protein